MTSQNFQGQANGAPHRAEGGAHLLLYGAVPDPSMLKQGFYAAEVEGLLRQPSVAEVRVTNCLGDVWRASYDGLVCYFYSYSAMAALLARLRGKPVVATGGAEQIFRSMAPGLPTFLGRIMLFGFTVLFANCILATSSTDYRQMRKIGWFRRSAIRLSFHGADALSRIDRANFSLQRSSGSLVTICGMDSAENIKRKGLLRAIDLLARLRERHADARLVVIGRTTCANLARDHAARLSCEDAVDFVGYVPEEEKIRLLRTSRYYVQLSEYEGFGIGALEALAMGCQVVHSNVGGLRDSVAGYGLILPFDGIAEFDTAAPYDIGDWAGFERHMAQFGVDRRANAILDAFSYR